MVVFQSDQVCWLHQPNSKCAGHTYTYRCTISVIDEPLIKWLTKWKKSTTPTAKYLDIGSCVILSTKRMSQKERTKKTKEFNCCLSEKNWMKCILSTRHRMTAPCAHTLAYNEHSVWVRFAYTNENNNRIHNHEKLFVRERRAHCLSFCLSHLFVCRF